ncbi:MAG: response regulator transcription factor [Bacteroidetes bacterium]|nr:response regulator transcription factor [Bacteroidota bacterium]
MSVSINESSLEILIADNYPIVRKGLIHLLHEEFPTSKITEAGNSQEVYEKVKGKIWDVILLDIIIPGSNGLEIMKELKTLGIKTPVLMLSTYSEEQYALRALKAGASGFLNKDSPTNEFIIAINKVVSGRKYVSESMAEKLADKAGENYSKSPHELLSDREMQVFQFIATGKTVSKIANDLSLSVNTINTYRARVLEKLCFTNNVELIRYAIDNKLV